MILLAMILSLGKLEEKPIPEVPNIIHFMIAQDHRAIGYGQFIPEAYLDAYARVPLLFRPFIKKVDYEATSCRIICTITFSRF